jgi:hypothetical protein
MEAERIRDRKRLNDDQVEVGVYVGVAEGVKVGEGVQVGIGVAV